MRFHLLVLFKFIICITQGFTQNLRSFVILIHDYPVKVEETELYSLVKKWRDPKDIEDAIGTDLIPPALPLIEE